MMALPVVVAVTNDGRRGYLRAWKNGMLLVEGGSERTVRVLAEWSGMQVCCAVAL